MNVRQWPIRTRILMTLVILTAAILLSVAAAFQLFVRGYVQSRESSQLDTIQANVLSNRRSAGHRGPEDGGDFGGRGKKFDGRQDRITGVQGNVVVLSDSGALLDTLGENREIGEELSAWFSSGHELSESVRKEAVSLDSGEYIVSVVCDPVWPDAYMVSYVDVTAIQAFTRRINLVLCGIILAVMALSVVLSRWVAGSLAEPVQDLSAFAREIGRGDFQRREFRFQDQEFSRLAESMNRMAEELQEANRKQETFFQNVSHELRTPLTSIRGNAEGVVCGIMDPAASCRVILAEADRLGGFVEDLLYLSRLGKAVPEVDAQPLDLRDALSLCVSEQRAEAEQRGLSFVFDFDGDPVLLSIRERDARQLLGNLISNAVRYAASTVTLSCHADASGVTVSVRDDGPGIAPEDLPHIFERFYRGAGGKHGIGLSIVQSITDACHGTISVTNEGGACFTLRFPGGGRTSDP